MIKVNVLSLCVNFIQVGNWMFVQKLLSLIAHAKNAAVVLRNIPGGLIVGTLPTVEVKLVLFNGFYVQNKTRDH